MRGYLRAIRVLTFISKSLSNPSAEVILKLFIAAAEPPLDSDAHFWSSYSRCVDKRQKYSRAEKSTLQGKVKEVWRKRGDLKWTKVTEVLLKEEMRNRDNGLT